VADFIQCDPLNDLRNLLQIKILASLHHPKLILDHALSGGASMYSKGLLAKESVSAIITPGQNALVNYAIRFGGQKLEDASFELRSVREIEQIIDYFQIEEIILNELVGYPKPKILELVDFLIGLAKDNPDLTFTYLVHDYFGVCPIYTLLDYNIKYCGVPSDLSYCDKCLQLNPLMNVVAPLVKQDYPTLTMNVWREHFGELLACVSKIVCFSQSSKTILQRAYPQLPDEKIEVTPHSVDWVRPVDIRKNSEQLNIAVVGHLEVQKGAQIVSMLATYMDYHNLNILIHVFGEIFEPNESFGFLKKVVKHGRFTRTDLPKLMEENEIDLVLIPSICPETFSFTTEEAMSMHLPLAVFDLGAPAERVRHYDKGIVLQQQDPEYVIGKIYEQFNRKLVLNSNIGKDITFVCVSNNELVYDRNLLSSAFMTEHPIIKYDNRETNLPIPKRYNDAIDKLTASDYRGWIFFVHNDFSLLEPLDPVLQKLDPNCLYGPIGAVLQNGEKKLVGQILQGHNGGLLYHGTRIDQPAPVDTVDCQALLVHTDLLRSHPVRFDEDERLAFHQYVEEFCVQANVKYGVQTYAIPIQCKHTNWRTPKRSFDLAIDYIHSKYPNKQWAGTFTHLS
jgi:glycosyltransferase involved in cell wall biosynthesis